MLWLAALDNKISRHYYLRLKRRTRSLPAVVRFTNWTESSWILFWTRKSPRFFFLFVLFIYSYLFWHRSRRGVEETKENAHNFCARMFNKWKEVQQDCNQQKTAIYSRGSEKRGKKWPEEREARNYKILKNRSFKRRSRRFFFIHRSILRDLVEHNCVPQTSLFPLTSIGDLRSRSGFSVCSTLNGSF